MLIGVISDTHGLVRPQAVEVLRGADLIIHAGDVGKPAVLEALRAIAPVAAVRGNVDIDAWAAALPEQETVMAQNHKIHVLHDLSDVDFDPAKGGYSVVIFGHSHKPSLKLRDRVLYLNPGSAGPRRLSLPIAVARLRISTAGIDPEIIHLEG